MIAQIKVLHPLSKRFPGKIIRLIVRRIQLIGMFIWYIFGSSDFSVSRTIAKKIGFRFPPLQIRQRYCERRNAGVRGIECTRYAQAATPLNQKIKRKIEIIIQCHRLLILSLCKIPGSNSRFARNDYEMTLLGSSAIIIFN